MNIGKALKDTRLKSGLRQNLVADKTGVSQCYLSSIENGGKVPSIEVIEKLCDFYKMPVAIVLFRAIDIKDIPQRKREAWRLLSPSINEMIDRCF